jgi:hypothetical protein
MPSHLNKNAPSLSSVGNDNALAAVQIRRRHLVPVGGIIS